MNATLTFKTCLMGLALALMFSLTASAVPNDAGFKARGMRGPSAGVRTYSPPLIQAESGRRVYSYAPAPALPPRDETGRRAESYQPAPVGPCEVAPAPSGTRSYSYEPGAGVRSYSYEPAPVRTWRAAPRSNYGGGYPSKANLKY